MNKKSDYARITISITPKLNTQIRLEAVKTGVSLSEMVEIYRNAYLEKLEREKAEKKTEKEQEQN